MEKTYDAAVNAIRVRLQEARRIAVSMEQRGYMESAEMWEEIAAYVSGILYDLGEM